MDTQGYYWHTHKERRAHVTTWQSPRYPLCWHSMLNHWRLPSHTHTPSGVTFISPLKQWIYENVVLSVCVCVLLLLFTAAADGESSCMISLHTRKQAGRCNSSDFRSRKVLTVHWFWQCETRKCPHKGHHGQHTPTQSRDHAVGVYFAGGSLKWVSHALYIQQDLSLSLILFL